MEINKLLNKDNFNSGGVGRIKYIVIHYTGSLGDAKQQCEYFAGGYRGASAHYFVGFDGSIWQSVEDANVAWHCGSKKYQHPNCRNTNSLGIEMCCKTAGSTKIADENWYFEDATVKSAIELTKELMKKYGIPAENVLRHYDVTGKYCPAPYVFNKGKHTWNDFKKAITKGPLFSFLPKEEKKPPIVDDDKIIWDYLSNKCELNDFAVAGIMGNLYAESGLKSTNLQNSFEKKLGMNDQAYTKNVDSGIYSKEKFVKDKAGYGLAQWTYWSRKQGLYEYIKSKNKSIGDLESQLEYFWKEVSGNKVLLSRLKSAKNVREASDAILHIYEKPQDQSEAVEKKRASYGDTFYKFYSGTK